MHVLNLSFNTLRSSVKQLFVITCVIFMFSFMIHYAPFEAYTNLEFPIEIKTSRSTVNLIPVVRFPIVNELIQLNDATAPL